MSNKNTIVVSEITRETYDLDGAYISNEIVEYVITSSQNINRSYTRMYSESNFGSISYRYNPQTNEVTCL
jgi:hypothetical protein